MALVAVLAATAALVAAFVRSTAGGEADPGTTGAVLAALTALFALRVVGQVLVRARAPRFLPATEDWNLMPYRLLLPIQIAFLAAMTLVAADLLRGGTGVADASPAFGRATIWFAVAYAVAMVIRYGVRMTRRPGERWFGGTIPIVFHLVLAAYVFVLGIFHASY